MLCFYLSNLGKVKENGVMSLKLNKVRGHTCHLCIEKVFAKQKPSFNLCVRFKFLPPERIKYLYSEKLLTGSDWCVDFSLIVHSLMSSIQLLGHSMGRLHPWVFHAPKVPLGAGSGFRVVNGPHFKAEPSPSLKYIFEARFTPNAKFIKWVRHVHSLFVNGNATECNVSQEEKLSRMATCCYKTNYLE